MIKFPRLHIAQSTANRIRNIAAEIDGERRMRQARNLTPNAPENLATGQLEGAVVESSTITPTPPVSDPSKNSPSSIEPDGQNILGDSVLEGQSLLNTLI